MEKSKEYKISVVLSSVSLVLFCIAAITGVIGGMDIRIDKICFHLGIALLLIGYLFLMKMNNSNHKDK